VLRGTAPADDDVLQPVGGVGLDNVVVGVVGAHLTAATEVEPVGLERPGNVADLEALERK